MKKKYGNSYQQIETNNQVYRQAILTALSKLNDQHTVKTGLEEFKEILSCYGSDSERVGIAVTAVQETNSSITSSSNTKAFTKRESIRLVGVLAAVFGDRLIEWLPKVLQVMSKRVKDSDSTMATVISETYGELIEQSLKGVEIGLGIRSVDMAIKSVAGQFSHAAQIQTLQIAGMSLQHIIQSSPPQAMIELKDSTAQLLLELLLHYPKVASNVLEALLAFIMGIEQAFTPFVSAVLPMLVTHAANSAWSIRKISLDVLYTLTVFACEALIPQLSVVFETLNTAKFDKIKHVRDSAAAAIAVIKEKLPQQCERIEQEKQQILLEKQQKEAMNSNSNSHSKQARMQKAKPTNVLTAHNGNNNHNNNNSHQDQTQTKTITLQDFEVAETQVKSIESQQPSVCSERFQQQQQQQQYLSENKKDDNRGRSRLHRDQRNTASVSETSKQPHSVAKVHSSLNKNNINPAFLKNAVKSDAVEIKEGRRDLSPFKQQQQQQLQQQLFQQQQQVQQVSNGGLKVNEEVIVEESKQTNNQNDRLKSHRDELNNQGKQQQQQQQQGGNNAGQEEEKEQYQQALLAQEQQQENRVNAQSEQEQYRQQAENQNRRDHTHHHNTKRADNKSHKTKGARHPYQASYIEDQQGIDQSDTQQYGNSIPKNKNSNGHHAQPLQQYQQHHNMINQQNYQEQSHSELKSQIGILSDRMSFLEASVEKLFRQQAESQLLMQQAIGLKLNQFAQSFQAQIQQQLQTFAAMQVLQLQKQQQQQQAAQVFNNPFQFQFLNDPIDVFSSLQQQQQQTGAAASVAVAGGVMPVLPYQQFDLNQFSNTQLPQQQSLNQAVYAQQQQQQLQSQYFSNQQQQLRNQLGQQIPQGQLQPQHHHLQHANHNNNNQKRQNGANHNINNNMNGIMHNAAGVPSSSSHPRFFAEESDSSAMISDSSSISHQHHADLPKKRIDFSKVSISNHHSNQHSQQHPQQQQQQQQQPAYPNESNTNNVLQLSQNQQQGGKDANTIVSSVSQFNNNFVNNNNNNNSTSQQYQQQQQIKQQNVMNAQENTNLLLLQQQQQQQQNQQMQPSPEQKSASIDDKEAIRIALASNNISKAYDVALNSSDTFLLVHLLTTTHGSCSQLAAGQQEILLKKSCTLLRHPQYAQSVLDWLDSAINQQHIYVSKSNNDALRESLKDYELIANRDGGYSQKSKEINAKLLAALDKDSNSNNNNIYGVSIPNSSATTTTIGQQQQQQQQLLLLNQNTSSSNNKPLNLRYPEETSNAFKQTTTTTVLPITTTTTTDANNPSYYLNKDTKSTTNYLTYATGTTSNQQYLQSIISPPPPANTATRSTLQQQPQEINAISSRLDGIITSNNSNKIHNSNPSQLLLQNTASFNTSNNNNNNNLIDFARQSYQPQQLQQQSLQESVSQQHTQAYNTSLETFANNDYSQQPYGIARTETRDRNPLDSLEDYKPLGGTTTAAAATSTLPAAFTTSFGINNNNNINSNYGYSLGQQTWSNLQAYTPSSNINSNMTADK